MTLMELCRIYPDKFYPQTWYLDEAFMYREASTPITTPPQQYVSLNTPPPPTMPLPHAVDLAWWWCLADSPVVWQHYLWCADVDHRGQRVYVGQNTHGLEIHRHIHLTPRFICALWS